MKIYIMADRKMMGEVEDSSQMSSDTFVQTRYWTAAFLESEDKWLVIGRPEYLRLTVEALRPCCFLPHGEWTSDDAIAEMYPESR